MPTLISIKQKLKHSLVVVAIWGMFHRPKKERRVSYGEENPDKTFYIIGREDMIGGGWALLVQVLMHIIDRHLKVKFNNNNEHPFYLCRT